MVSNYQRSDLILSLWFQWNDEHTSFRQVMWQKHDGVAIAQSTKRRQERAGMLVNKRSELCWWQQTRMSWGWQSDNTTTKSHWKALAIAATLPFPRYRRTHCLIGTWHSWFTRKHNATYNWSSQVKTYSYVCWWFEYHSHFPIFKTIPTICRLPVLPCFAADVC